MRVKTTDRYNIHKIRPLSSFNVLAIIQMLLQFRRLICAAIPRQLPLTIKIILNVNTMSLLCYVRNDRFKYLSTINIPRHMHCKTKWHDTPYIPAEEYDCILFFLSCPPYHSFESICVPIRSIWSSFSTYSLNWLIHSFTQSLTRSHSLHTLSFIN